MAQRTVGILLFPDVEELDWAGPYEVFGAAVDMAAERQPSPEPISDEALRTGPLRLVTIAQTKDPVRCRKGLKVVPDHDFADAPPLDVIVVPGGMGTRVEVGNSVLIDWLRKAGARCEWVTSVCTGALLLHEAGFAQGKRVTTHFGFIDQLQARGDVEVLKRRRYVRDGNVVTSAGVSAGIDMSLWLVGQMYSPDFARALQHYIEYDPAPPYSADV